VIIYKNTIKFTDVLNRKIYAFLLKEFDKKTEQNRYFDLLQFDKQQLAIIALNLKFSKE